MAVGVHHRDCREELDRRSFEGSVVVPSSQTNLPRQGDAVVAGVQDADRIGLQLMEILKPPSDVDYLQVRPALKA